MIGEGYLRGKLGPAHSGAQYRQHPNCSPWRIEARVSVWDGSEIPRQFKREDEVECNYLIRVTVLKLLFLNHPSSFKDPSAPCLHFTPGKLMPRGVGEGLS